MGPLLTTWYLVYKTFDYRYMGISWYIYHLPRSLPCFLIVFLRKSFSITALLRLLAAAAAPSAVAAAAAAVLLTLWQRYTVRLLVLAPRLAA